MQVFFKIYKYNVKKKMYSMYTITAMCQIINLNVNT